MGKSVKLKDLMNNPAYKRVSGDEESLEREVFCLLYTSDAADD